MTRGWPGGALADLALPVVVYGRDGRTALVLPADRDDEGFTALKARLARKGFRLVADLPRAPLRDWAEAGTPEVVLFKAATILREREEAPR